MGLLFWVFIFCFTLFCLLRSSDFFIDSAEKIGAAIGIPSFVIGATIVALGTSLPELASSIAAVMQKSTEIVVANVVGSNITNIFLVAGGVSLLFAKVKFSFKASIADYLVFAVSAALAAYFSYDGIVKSWEAGILLLILLSYLISILFQVGNEEAEEDTKLELKYFLILLLGGLGVFVSATYNIESIIAIAKILNIEEGYIALGAVALGTSLPELFVSIGAARKNKLGIALGNIIGSNIFNVVAVIGISGIISPLQVPDYIINMAIPLFLLATVIFLIILFAKQTNRIIGLLCIGLYAYYIYQIFSNTVV